MKKLAKPSKGAQRIVAAQNELIRRGSAAIVEGRAEEAEQIARLALSKNPHEAGALHVLGVAQLAQNRPDEAICSLEQATRECADAAIETDLATAYRQAGRMADARVLLEHATSRQPPNAHAFHDLGVLLFLQRELPQAEAMLRRGLEVAPAMPELSVSLGNIYLDRGDHENAKIAFARALANSPGHPGAIQGLGTAQLCDGDFARAAQRFRQVLSRDPENVMALLNLGCCLLELGHWDEACQQLRAAVRIAPQNYHKALKTLVMAGRGRFWFRPSEAAKFAQLGDSH